MNANHMHLVAIAALFRVVIAITTVSFLSCANATELDISSAKSSLQRMIVLSDIEADPDDSQSFIRLFLYANQIELQGLIATTSVHQKNMAAVKSIEHIIDGYEQVRNNLSLHEEGFPEADKLRALVKQGLPVYGMQGVGAGKDSQGSEWIINVLQQNDPRPLWISVWGGANTLAQALYKLKSTKDANELNQLISKLRVYTISDQDDSGSWIRKNFPELFYIVSPGGYGAATWTGINSYVDGIDNHTISNQWLAANIQQSHGPLGAMYPDVAYGMEGDTPSWLNLVPNGLSDPERPNWGGWGGRYELYVPQLKDMDPSGFTGGVAVEPETRAIWTNAIDQYSPATTSEYGRSLKPGTQTFKGYRETLWRWRDAIQNDFASRMDWTVKPYNAANHPPIPKLNHEQNITVKSGGSFHLDARGSSDPDGDSLSYYWFNYPEVGSMNRQPIKVDSAENMARVHVKAPQVTKPETLQFILQVTDRGTPALTRYQRVFVRVVP